jgi:hypothetical protein
LQVKCDKQDETIKHLQDLVEELEQYGWRNALRFANVLLEDIPRFGETPRLDTDSYSYIVELCCNELHLDISREFKSRDFLAAICSRFGSAQKSFQPSQFAGIITLFIDEVYNNQVRTSKQGK